jgi:hypothetical protein
VPLHFFDDIADETHGRKVAAAAETAKGICRAGPQMAQISQIKNKPGWFCENPGNCGKAF